MDLIQTVVACDLKEYCYRVPYVEYYYEIVDQADGIKEEKLKVGTSKNYGCVFKGLHTVHVQFATPPH